MYQTPTSWTNLGSSGGSYIERLDLGIGYSFPPLTYEAGRYFNLFDGDRIAQATVGPGISGSAPRAVEVIIRSPRTKPHSTVISMGLYAALADSFAPGVRPDCL